MFKDLEILYSDLGKFYVFDKKKYNLEEFMSDIKTFIKQFKDAYTQMMKEREADEKLIRFREARKNLAVNLPKFRVSPPPALDL
jgi:diaphanous 2